jgi:phytoene dehydrogenase-like protein
MAQVTVVGGGVAGLVAAIECAEAGAPTRLLEARRALGGRAGTAPGPFAANLGPHAFYDGPLWRWLAARGLHRPYRRPRALGLRFRWRGEVHRLPPRELAAAYRLRRRPAPVDASLRDWLTAEAGPAVAAAVGGLAGVLTFDPDPGRLSAAFVWERVERILFTAPPVARYVEGGWGAAVARLEAHARALGVAVETGAKVTSLDELGRRGPVILAVGPRAARDLTGDDGLRVESPRVTLVDLGLVARRGDPYIVSDLDEGTFVDRFTAVDRTLAPGGHSLVQASVGQGPGESLDEAVARVEAVVDGAFPGWRGREVWRRRSSVVESTGALDLPGTTWRDRPPVRRADGLLVCGDWVAAPGHLAEVAWASATEAARHAVAAAHHAVAGPAPAVRPAALSPAPASGAAAAG